MGIKELIKIKKHKNILLKRVLELRHTIFKKALLEGKVDDVDRTLFMKYNDKLKKLKGW